jgi:hypothetical protein
MRPRGRPYRRVAYSELTRCWALPFKNTRMPEYALIAACMESATWDFLSHRNPMVVSRVLHSDLGQPPCWRVGSLSRTQSNAPH